MTASSLPAQRLNDVYHALHERYGQQHWWPAETRFEVIVGAVLTQNAAWTNVERAIDQLRSRRLLTLAALTRAAPDEVAAAIRPSGYYNIKRQRLDNLCRFLSGIGGVGAFARWPLPRQRSALLAVNGVGPETADDILLYAFGQPVFVIDAYTRRLLQRLGLIVGNEGYESLRGGFEQALPVDVAMYKEYHALIVTHAKAHCRKRPACEGCPLQAGCPTAAGGPPAAAARSGTGSLKT